MSKCLSSLMESLRQMTDRIINFFEVDLKSEVDCASCKLNKKGNVSLRDGNEC